MNAAVLDLARKIRTAEQQRFADSCMRASAEVRARWAGKGFGTATLNELTKLLNNLIDDRAKSLATEIARVLEAAPGALSNEDKAQLKSDYLTDIDSFQSHAEAVLEEMKKGHHSSRMNARYTTRSGYAVTRQRYSNELDLMFLKQAADFARTAPLEATRNVRKADDAEIQRVVRTFFYPSQEATFRRLAENWSIGDFLYAMDRVQIDVEGTHRFDVLQLIRKLRDEREAADARAISDAANARRHAELLSKMNMPAKAPVSTLDVLQMVASAEDGYSGTASKAEFALFKELEAGNYITGQIGADTHDAPDTMVEEVRLSTDGRLLMERMLREKSVAPSLETQMAVANVATNPKSIFLVHGHDERNLFRLKELLRERYKLEPIVLAAKPGKGRTIIEKFEAEARNAAFAFVLLTPDDAIEKDGVQYGQARPNVIFELGWFYGRLGRDKVCILFKKGTTIHSDLNGVSRIEFSDAVNEKIEEIEAELLSGGILSATDIQSLRTPASVTSKSFFEKAKKFF